MSCQPGRKHKTAPKENKIQLKNVYFITIYILRLLKTYSMGVFITWLSAFINVLDYVSY